MGHEGGANEVRIGGGNRLGQLAASHPANAHRRPIVGDGWIVAQLLLDPGRGTVPDDRNDGAAMVTRPLKAKGFPIRLKDPFTTDRQSEETAAENKISAQRGLGNIFDHPWAVHTLEELPRWRQEIRIENAALALRLCGLAIGLAGRRRVDTIILLPMRRKVRERILLDKRTGIAFLGGDIDACDVEACLGIPSRTPPRSSAAEKVKQS